MSFRRDHKSFFNNEELLMVVQMKKMQVLFRVNILAH